VLGLKDVFPNEDPEVQIEKIKAVTSWIESLPISSLPYVEMGFDALDELAIAKLSELYDTMKASVQAPLKCNELEFLDPNSVFAEQYPFWSSPFYQPKQPTDFKVGDRVMNTNSTKRQYVPYGLRGTVVGRTNDKVLVLFDDQYFNGSNIYGLCEDFRGGYVEPNYLINITKKFTKLQMNNP
jgi:hypothetical protein